MSSFKRFYELDALRGLAAISVVFYHYFYRYDKLYGHPNLSVKWADLGQFGVELFFIVSGFVIYWTLNRIEKPLDFIVSRFSRLYPVYWVCGLITFICVSIFGLPGREVDIVAAFQNLSMVQEYFSIPLIDGVYWTLTLELTFYFWMFLFFVAKRHHISEFLFLPFIGLSIFVATSGVSLWAPLKLLFIVNNISFFVAGICFFKIWDKSSSFSTFLILILTLITTCFTYSFVHFFIFLLLYLLFYFVVQNRLKFIAVKPLIFLGNISYALYLIHQNVGYVVINQLYKINITGLLSISLALSLSIVLAVGVTYFVEKPSLKLIRQLYKTYSSK